MRRKYRIAFANARYRSNDTRGANAHVFQFIHQSASLGHQVWLWPGNSHPEGRTLGRSRLRRLLDLREMDILYTRLQEKPPGVVRYALPPTRQLVGSPLVVWEFNTVPEFHEVMGRTQLEVQQTIHSLQRFGKGCDLAICVSNAINDYVRHKLGLRRVVTVTNGSDPDLFHPDVPPAASVQRRQGCLNVAWIGSGDIAWHNFEILYAATSILYQQGMEHKIHFHIIGEPPQLPHPTPPNIIVHGPVPYVELPSWLAVMDVGLCLYHPGPADYSSPLKLFDYMASGLAVVSTDQPQAVEILGVLDQWDQVVHPYEPQSLVSVLQRLYEDRQETRRRGLTGRQLVIERYSWRDLVRQIYAEIECAEVERRSR